MCCDPCPASSFADGYYPIGLTNSGNGDDTGGDDCNSGGGGGTGNSGRGSDKDNRRRGNNIHGDLHAYEHAYDGHSRPAPCPRTTTSLCLGLDEAI